MFSTFFFKALDTESRSAFFFWLFTISYIGSFYTHYRLE